MSIWRRLLAHFAMLITVLLLGLSGMPTRISTFSPSGAMASPQPSDSASGPELGANTKSSDEPQAAPSPPEDEKAEPLPARGDLDGNGSIDLYDVLRIRDILLHHGPAPTDQEYEAADINTDNVVDERDLEEVRSNALGTVDRTGKAAGITQGPTPDQVATALGLPTGVVVAVETTLFSGGRAISDPSSIAVYGDDKGLFISTGAAADLGAGSTDFAADGLPDETRLKVTLRVPAGMKALGYLTRFSTSEYDAPLPQSDRATLERAGAPPVILAVVGNVRADFPAEARAVDVSGASSVTLVFVVTDAGNGVFDSGLLLQHMFFSATGIAVSQALADFLLLNSSIGTPVAVNLDATSGSTEFVDVLSASRGTVRGSLLLSTGLASDGGRGSTDLGDDQAPDETRFELTLRVPQNDKTKSLVYNSQFITSEIKRSGTERGADSASLHFSTSTGATGDQTLGKVIGSADVDDAPVTHAIDVENATEVTLTFAVRDVNDLGLGDTALLLFGIYFSDFEASLLEEPRPSDYKLHTGTFAYSKTLLAASSGVSPFSFLVHYSSTPTRFNSRLGLGWGHCYEWLAATADDGSLFVRRGDGGVETFEPVTGTNRFKPKHGGIFSTVSKNDDGFYLYKSKEQVQYLFDDEGKLQSIVDLNGNKTILAYSDDDLLTTVTDGRGQSGAFSYDDRKRLVGVSYAGKSAAFEYDDKDELVALADASGARTAFTYDDEHNLLTGTDGTGTVFVTNLYDDLHRVVEQRDGVGNVTKSEYTPSQVTRTDRDGNTEVTEIDPLDRPVATVDGAGDRWSYTYDKDDNVTTATDPLGSTSRSAFDSRGNAVEEVDAAGGVLKKFYNLANRPLRGIDEGGGTISFGYDGAENLIRHTDQLGQRVTYSYGSRGLVDRFLDAGGNEFHYGFTNRGEPSERRNPLGGVERASYDNLGRILHSTDANGNRTGFGYDDAGRVVSIRDALGGERRTEYDREGRITAETNEIGETRRFVHDGNGNVVRAVDPAGGVVAASYNGEELPVRLTDPAGRSSRFEYDAAKRLVRVTDPAGGIVRVDYDASGRLSAIQDPRGNTTQFSYDALDRPIAMTDPLGRTLSNTYDTRGRITSVTNGRHQVILCEYDAVGRLTVINMPTRHVQRTFDANGNRVQTIGDGTRRSTRTFDALGRLTSVCDARGRTIRYAYDAVGNLVTLVYSDGTVVKYTYDALNRMTSVTDWGGRRTTYSYDANGRLVGIVMPDGSRATRQYDTAGRLVGARDEGPDGTTTYQTRVELDASGLRVAEDAILPIDPPVTTVDHAMGYDAANQVVPDATTAWSYDGDGNLVRGVVGRLPVSLTYDEVGRLTAMGATTYEYDDDGLRSASHVNGETSLYVQDPRGDVPRVLEEEDEKGRIVARYVYGMGLISRHDKHDPTLHVDGGDADDAGGAHGVWFYHYDMHGSAIALSDGTGQITDRYAYDPYGTIVARDGHTANPFTYGGRDGVMDDGNGLYFMSNRYYDPRAMRFITRDDVAIGKPGDGQTLNRYTFARGNPIQFADPSGMWFGLDDLVVAIGGAIVNVTAMFISDLVSWDWHGWEEYGGAITSGAAYAWVLYNTGNPEAAGIAGAAVGNATTQGLKIATGQQTSFHWDEFGAAVGVGLATAEFSRFSGKAVADRAALQRAAATDKLFQEFGARALVAAEQGAIKGALRRSLKSNNVFYISWDWSTSKENDDLLRAPVAAIGIQFQ